MSNNKGVIIIYHKQIRNNNNINIVIRSYSIII